MGYVQLSRSKLAAHIMELAASFNVTLVIVPDMPIDQAMNIAARTNDGRGERMVNAVQIAPIRCEKSYVAALHELGHAVDPTGQLRLGTAQANNMNLKMDEELAAWKWARKHALVWTIRMEHYSFAAFSTYVRDAALSGTVPNLGSFVREIFK